MLALVRYHWRLHELKGARKRAIRTEIKLLNKLGPPERSERIDTVSRSSIEPFEEHIDDLFSRRLTAKAQKYGVSQSQFDWYWSKHRKHFLLTPAATEALNSTVHEARKRRGEVFRLWLPALASTISAFVALAAVILGRR